jgi:hypothetical protein
MGDEARIQGRRNGKNRLMGYMEKFIVYSNFFESGQPFNDRKMLS